MRSKALWAQKDYTLWMDLFETSSNFFYFVVITNDHRYVGNNWFKIKSPRITLFVHTLINIGYHFVF